MSKVLSAFGALAAIANLGAYGTDANPTKALRVIGKPNYGLDESFDTQEFLGLENDGALGDRKKNKIDISFQCAISYMEDIDFGRPDIAELLIGGGACEIKNESGAGGAGAGNFIEIGPISTGLKDTTIYGYKKEDGAGLLTRIKYLGTRFNWTYNVAGAQAATLDISDGGGLHNFWEAFGAAIPAPTGLLGGPNYIDGRCFSLTFNGIAVPFSAFSFSPNLAISIPDGDVQACNTGVSEINQAVGQMGGEITITFTDELIAAAGNNWLRQFQNGNIDIEVVLTYNDGIQLMSFTMPKVRVQPFNLVDGDLNDSWTLTYVAQPVAGDDHFTWRWEVL